MYLGSEVSILNKRVFNNTVSSINLYKRDSFIDFDINDEYDKISLLFDFLNNTNSKNITEDFIKEYNKLGLKYDYYLYMYFMYLIKKYNIPENTFSGLYVKNVNDLYYLNDLEARFDNDKFRLHYRVSFTDFINLSNPVDSSIVNYVSKNLPSNLNGDLELAIAIYVLVCNIVQYDSKFLITGDLEDTNSFENVTINNPRGVCVQTSIIYHSLLKMYGIDSKLCGDIHNHLNVNLRIGTMMINADPTKFGYFSQIDDLSDLTNVKLGFLPEGFILLTKYYVDANYVKYNVVRLYNAIRNVYRKMGLEIDKQDKFSYLLDKMQKGEFGFGLAVNKEDIDRRMSMVNSFPLIEYSNVENYQYLSKIVTYLFKDIFDDRVENLIIFKKEEDGKVNINSLFVIYDEEMVPYYYLPINGKFVNLSVNEVCDYMLNNNWLFKNGSDVDALYLKDNKLIYKLVV